MTLQREQREMKKVQLKKNKPRVNFDPALYLAVLITVNGLPDLSETSLETKSLFFFHTTLPAMTRIALLTTALLAITAHAAKSNWGEACA